jgi:hypothetical protein
MSDSPIVYEDRLLAFLDILGFSERLLRSGKDQKLGRELLDFFVSLKTLLARFQSDDFAVTLFSDTLCISSREPPNFSSFCCGLSLIVTSLLGLNYTVRGAVSRGLLYHKGDIIFGPCLVRAHNLENTLAIFPRIIIDPNLEANLDPEGRLFEPIYADLDGLRCVNYLSPILLEVVFRLVGLPAQLVPFEDEEIMTINSPFWIAGQKKVIPRRAPDVGEHSEVVLREAGYSETEIRAMRGDGVIR